MTNIRPTYGNMTKDDSPVAGTQNNYYILHRMVNENSMFIGSPEIMFYDKMRDKNNLYSMFGMETSFHFSRGFR